ncbi:flagellar basal body rod protein [Rhizobiaceae bacterium BDR2-2]|uniref:Flagellar basal body rod protein n=1 Tax=Ectorhizobium quercum TaxID=2965071 RepID=A0AAE3SUZ5_9HYPH|nr:flagellar basal body rod C-terminal domain-containing protein [Ectorhizobium quercum]MCX8997790.1 flagellar basal body rod protein [Ectorhizobium quercum]
MTISSMTAIAITGMQAAATQFTASASNIAHVDTVEYQKKAASFATLQPGGVEAKVTATDAGVSLDRELYDMIGAKIAYEANATVFETGADLWQVLSTIKRD